MRLKQLLGIVLFAGARTMAADTVSQSGDDLATNQNSADAQKAGATTVSARPVARGGDSSIIEISGSGDDDDQGHEADAARRAVMDIPNSVLPGTFARRPPWARRREIMVRDAATAERTSRVWALQTTTVLRSPEHVVVLVTPTRSTDACATSRDERDCGQRRCHAARDCCAGTCCAGCHNSRKNSGEGRGSDALQV